MSNTEKDHTQTFPTPVQSTLQSRAPSPKPAHTLASGLQEMLGTGTGAPPLNLPMTAARAQPVATDPAITVTLPEASRSYAAMPPPANERALIPKITEEDMLIDTRISYDFRVIDMKLKTPQMCNPARVREDVIATFAYEMGMRTGHPDGLPSSAYMIRWMPPPPGPNPRMEEGYYLITIPSKLEKVAETVLDLKVVCFQRDQYKNTYRFARAEHTYKAKSGVSVADHEDNWCLYHPQPDTRFGLLTHQQAAMAALAAVGLIVPKDDPRCFHLNISEDGGSKGHYHCAYEIEWDRIPRDRQWNSHDLSSLKRFPVTNDPDDEEPEYGTFFFKPDKIRKVFGLCGRCYKTPRQNGGPCMGHDEDGKKKERILPAAVRNTNAMQRINKRAKKAASQDYSF